MVPPDELYAVGIPQLETSQERDGLDAKQTTIDIVTYTKSGHAAAQADETPTKEQIIGVRRVATDSENLD